MCIRDRPQIVKAYQQNVLWDAQAAPCHHLIDAISHHIIEGKYAGDILAQKLQHRLFTARHLEIALSNQLFLIGHAVFIQCIPVPLQALVRTHQIQRACHTAYFAVAKFQQVPRGKITATAVVQQNRTDVIAAQLAVYRDKRYLAFTDELHGADIIFCTNRGGFCKNNTVHLSISEHTHIFDIVAGIIAAVPINKVIACLVRRNLNGLGKVRKKHIAIIWYNKADDIRLFRHHTYGKLIGPVVQCLYCSQHFITCALRDTDIFIVQHKRDR